MVTIDKKDPNRKKFLSIVIGVILSSVFFFVLTFGFLNWANQNDNHYVPKTYPKPTLSSPTKTPSKEKISPKKPKKVSASKPDSLKKNMIIKNEYFEDGVFIVGEDLQLGQYTGQYSTDCLMEINGFSVNSDIVSLNQSDHLTVANCGRWEKK